MDQNQTILLKTELTESTPLSLRLLALTILIADIWSFVLVGKSMYGTKFSTKQFQMLVTPPAWTFWLWVPIYASLFCVTLIEVLTDAWSRSSVCWFILCCNFDIAATILVSYNQKAASIFSLSFYIGLQGCIYFLWRFFTDPQTSKNWLAFVTRNVFGMYYAWSLLLTFLNLGIVLEYLLYVDQITFVYVYFVGVFMIFVYTTLQNYQNEGRQGFTCWIGAILVFTICITGSVQSILGYPQRF